ncbi:MAG: NlpC/P60 family protein, partial [Phycisphaerales bacterium]
GDCVLKTAYIQRADASLGYLPYTPRTILNQAFKLLNTPYGWGGLFGEQDCSRFIQEVFATVGLVLPRNSSEQARVGRLIYANAEAGSAQEKIAALREQAVPALTLLRTSGHIMLFLGFVDGRPYILHDLWGYSVDESTVAVVNRVAVTPADLGNSSSGTLLDHVNTIRVLDKPSPQK